MKMFIALVASALTAITTTPVSTADSFVKPTPPIETGTWKYTEIYGGFDRSGFAGLTSDAPGTFQTSSTDQKMVLEWRWIDVDNDDDGTFDDSVWFAAHSADTFDLGCAESSGQQRQSIRNPDMFFVLAPRPDGSLEGFANVMYSAEYPDCAQSPEPGHYDLVLTKA